MFRFRLSPLAAFAGLLLIFGSCQRHHLGELPELQREHLHPLQTAEMEKQVERKADVGAPTVTPTPTNFFPNEKP